MEEVSSVKVEKPYPSHLRIFRCDDGSYQISIVEPDGKTCGRTTSITLSADEMENVADNLAAACDLW